MKLKFETEDLDFRKRIESVCVNSVLFLNWKEILDPDWPRSFLSFFNPFAMYKSVRYAEIHFYVDFEKTYGSLDFRTDRKALKYWGDRGKWIPMFFLELFESGVSFSSKSDLELFQTSIMEKAGELFSWQYGIYSNLLQEEAI